MRRFACLILLCLLPAASMAAEDARLPVPRFVSLKSAQINVRSGPGTRYPIAFVYRRDGLPVEIVEEFDQWRKIRDVEGGSGWVHRTMLDGRRMALIRGKKPQLLYSDPTEESGPVLKAAPMVQARLLACRKAWCRVSVQNVKGWLRKEALWGVYPDEQFE
jgi:SH3-like domain-containing protein